MALKDIFLCDEPEDSDGFVQYCVDFCLRFLEGSCQDGTRKVTR